MVELTFLAAFFLSGVAAYYSIVGLTLIFTGSFYSIVIMGSALEISKLVAASWIYRNWKFTAVPMRLYMLFAISILMLITSMGIFGFLSRSHLESAVFSSDNLTNKITLIDTRIEAKRNASLRVEKQLDALDKSFDRYLQLGSVTKGIAERNKMKAERSLLEDENKQIAMEILQLQEERSIILNELNAAQVEVGPLKYIAELIYGDESEKHFDSAVRWVIITIVFVFDPLAVVLLIAANQSLIMRNKSKPKPKPPILTKDGKVVVDKDSILNLGKI